MPVRAVVSVEWGHLEHRESSGMFVNSLVWGSTWKMAADSTGEYKRSEW